MRFNDLLKLLYLVDTRPRDLLHTIGFSRAFVCTRVFVNKCFAFFLKANTNPFAKLLCKVFLRGLKKFGRPSIYKALLQSLYKRVEKFRSFIQFCFNRELQTCSYFFQCWFLIQFYQIGHLDFFIQRLD